jgi:hypothetical protein
MQTITERQVLLIGRRLNNQKELGEELQELLSKAEEGEVKVTKEQAQKDFNWLMNLYKTPRGIERKNNPYGYREMSALDSGLDYFTYDGHFDAGTYGFSWYAPIYTFVGKDGGSFQYYVKGGQIQIIG